MKKKYTFVDHGQTIKSITVDYGDDNAIGQISSIEGDCDKFIGDHVLDYDNHIGRKFSYSPMMEFCMMKQTSLLVIKAIEKNE